MDDGEPGRPQRAVHRAREALTRGAPHARMIARTGKWTVRTMRWRKRMHTGFDAGHLMMDHLQSTLRIAYSVLPLPTPHQVALRQEATWIAQPTPAEPPRARLIVNPASGTIRLAGGMYLVREVVDWLNTHGLPTEIRETEYAAHAAELAKEAVKIGMEMVIAAGGDGTVNSVIQALAGTTTTLGVLPLGTVNVWAREMNIPLNVIQACEVLVHGVRRRVDLGRAGHRYFLLMAGIGMDAEVARQVEHSWLKRLGLKFLDYLATATRLSVTQPSTKVTIRYDGKRQTMKALMVLIGNTRLYGGALTFATRALADDGQLDIVVIGGEHRLARLSVFLRALLRRPSLGPRVRYIRCTSARIDAAAPLPVQVDGEVFGTLPMAFSIVPRALTVIVPENAPAELFVREPVK